MTVGVHQGLVELGPRPGHASELGGELLGAFRASVDHLELRSFLHEELGGGLRHLAGP